MKKGGAGFTIVELLIVVVVIAILAAITIVSYNGIAQRAQNAQILSRIDSYAKAFLLYKESTGAYPTVLAAETGQANTACLGNAEEYPAEGPFLDGACFKGTSYQLSTSPTLNNQLQTIISGLPQGALPTVAGSDGQTFARGILFTSIGPMVVMQYLIKADQECGRGDKIDGGTTYPGAAICSIPLS